MACSNPVRQKLVSAIANVERHHGPHDPRLPELRAELVTERLSEIIGKTLESTSLNPGQRARIVRAVYSGLNGG